MFCKNCGKEIPDYAKFCTACGTAIDDSETVDAENTESNAEESAKAEDVGSKIADAGEKLGQSIDEAAGEIKKDVEDFGKNFSETADKASQKAEDIAKNWKDYVTPENMEKLGVASLFFPLILGLLKIVFRTIATPFWGLYYVIGFNPVWVLFVIVKVAFILVSLAAVLGIVYVLAQNESKHKTMSFVILGGSALSFIAILGISNGWGVINVILGLACLLVGIIAASIVFIQGKGMETEPNISEDLKAYKTAFNEYKAANPSNDDTTEVATVDGQTEGGSYFDGKGITIFGLLILTSIVGAITCSIGTPWMLCKIIKWRKSHTVIDGKRLDFNGTGGSLLGHWIVWSLLSIITCGIYSFWAYTAFKRWELEHTTYEGSDQPIGSFDGTGIEYLGYSLLGELITMFTCGIGGAWAITLVKKWEVRHDYLEGRKLRYDGTGLGLLGRYILVAVLTLITCGIYTAWGIVRINKYVYKNIHFDNE